MTTILLDQWFSARDFALPRVTHDNPRNIFYYPTYAGDAILI
jgi:hypothetical protein